jgi:hypothetical protein
MVQAIQVLLLLVQDVSNCYLYLIRFELLFAGSPTGAVGGGQLVHPRVPGRPEDLCHRCGQGEQGPLARVGISDLGDGPPVHT